MSHFYIDIVDRPIYYIELESIIGTTLSNNIEIEKYNDINIEIINTEKVLASDLPDDIPMTKIVGNLHVSRISELDDYLDSYEFDCGTP